MNKSQSLLLDEESKAENQQSIRVTGSSFIVMPAIIRKIAIRTSIHVSQIPAAD